MKTSFPTGLQALLGKLGIPTPHKPGEVKADAKGLHAEGKDAKGPEKGSLLGDGTVLAGLGFNGEDKKGAAKNVVEKANIDRFMQDPSNDVKEFQNALRQMKDAEPMEKAHAHEGHHVDKKEAKELKEEVRREEKLDDVRGQAAQETKEKKEARESAEAKEAEKERERDEEKDDREKHGGAWAQEEQEQDEQPKKRRGALYESDLLGERTRCHGKLEDGTRCLRKPLEGSAYCREHMVVSVPPVE